MNYNFDKVISRYNTHSLKWDDTEKRLGLAKSGLLPMWVADMDFAAPPSVNEAIVKLARHGIHGYFGNDSSYREAVCHWMAMQHKFHVEPEWIVITHGLVAAIGFAIQAFSRPEDSIAIFSPVYHMFGNTIRASGRRLIECPLQLVQGRYEMDLEQLAEQIDSSTKILLLCSPHNPGGRVWKKEELQDLAAFCIQHNLILISDEVHQDLVYSKYVHCSTANALPDIRGRLITLTAATKTFNLAGALTGNAIISNSKLRLRFQKALMACGSTTVNRFGVIAATTAYEHGKEWLDALIPYLQANRDYFDEAIARYMPGVRCMPLEATYLAWLNFSKTGLPPNEVAELLQSKAKIAVSKGESFGQGGADWMRFYFACPRPLLEEAIERLKVTFNS